MNISSFCDQHAKNAVIYSVFLLGFQKHWYLRCFVHLGSKKYWYLQHFLRFCMAPAKDVKTQKCCNLTAICDFRKAKNGPKNVSKRHFFSDFRYPQNGGECSWRRLWATRIPAKNLSPTLLKDFWWFSGPGVGGSAAGGAPHLRALVALGRSWRICQRTRGEPAEPNLRANAPRRLRRISRPSISSQCGGWKAFGWGPASEIYSLRFLKKKEQELCWK